MIYTNRCCHALWLKLRNLSIDWVESFPIWKPLVTNGYEKEIRESQLYIHELENPGLSWAEKRRAPPSGKTLNRTTWPTVMFWWDIQRQQQVLFTPILLTTWWGNSSTEEAAADLACSWWCQNHLKDKRCRLKRCHKELQTLLCSVAKTQLLAAYAAKSKCSMGCISRGPLLNCTVSLVRTRHRYS